MRRSYNAGMTANVTFAVGEAALSVADPSAPRAVWSMARPLRPRG
jgi:hypothetical protein